MEDDEEAIRLFKKILDDHGVPSDFLAGTQPSRGQPTRGQPTRWQPARADDMFRLDPLESEDLDGDGQRSNSDADDGDGEVNDGIDESINGFMLEPIAMFRLNLSVIYPPFQTLASDMAP